MLSEKIKCKIHILIMGIQIMFVYRQKTAEDYAKNEIRYFQYINRKQYTFC